MTTAFLNDTPLPFCKGCGHSVIAKNTEKALTSLGWDPLDVIMVTDIGCHGLIDKSFNTHTVHGLHGRSVALAAGVSAGLNGGKKKVVVFLGDGGATIGMQHLLDAAHNGFNMTVVIHNNMLYGMTGGQPSEFTPQGFKTPTRPTGSHKMSYDICQVLAAAGAPYVRRILGVGDYSEALAEAFARPGFSLLEIMEICPSYGVKANPEMKLAKVVQEAGLETIVFADKPAAEYQPYERPTIDNLLPEDDSIDQEPDHRLEGPVNLMICGSAGEGAQGAAELLARAAVHSGLVITKKGSYPVTVGVGFSSAEVIFSPKDIHYTGATIPDYMIITSQDGLNYGRKAAARMNGGVVFLDDSLEAPQTGAKIIRFPFREKAGGRSSSFLGIFYFLKETGIFPLDILVKAFNESRISKKLQAESLLEML